VPVEKWKSRLNEEIIKEVRPHTLWKICGNKSELWKKIDKGIVFHIFHRAHFYTACGKVENNI
jgi:hypothetical protein